MSHGEAGAPPRWETPEKLEAAMDGYFAQWKNLEEGHPQLKKTPNIFGLCLYADMSYDCFCDYENKLHDKRDPRFSESCKKAKLKLLEFNADRSLSHTAGVVFNTVNLTRKMAEPWRNAQTNEHTGENGAAIIIQCNKVSENL